MNRPRYKKCFLDFLIPKEDPSFFPRTIIAIDVQSDWLDFRSIRYRFHRFEAGNSSTELDNRLPGVSRAGNPSDLKDYETNKSAKPTNGVTIQGWNAANPSRSLPSPMLPRETTIFRNKLQKGLIISSKIYLRSRDFEQRQTFLAKKRKLAEGKT